MSFSHNDCLTACYNSWNYEINRYGNLLIKKTEYL